MHLYYIFSHSFDKKSSVKESKFVKQFFGELSQGRLTAFFSVCGCPVTDHGKITGGFSLRIKILFWFHDFIQQ